MELNLLMLSQYKKVAVHCDTEDKARMFFRAMMDYRPSAVENWRSGDTEWSWYKEGTCYAPHIYDNLNHGKMQFCDKSYWIEHGYTIIQIESLMPCLDFGEFETASLADIGLLGL